MSGGQDIGVVCNTAAVAMIGQLVGPPACGKRTIGALIAERTGAALVDNHLINDPVFTALGVTGMGSGRKAAFYPVWLTCDPEQLRHRLTLPERAVRNKLRDPSKVEEILALGVTPAPDDALQLETTELEADTAADEILAWIDAHH